ncbi:hypothetical protein ACWEO1_06305 [Kitasatospora cineracea]
MRHASHTFVVSTTDRILARGTTGTDLSTGTACTPRQLADGIAAQHDLGPRMVWVHLWEGVTPERDMPAHLWQVPSRATSYLYPSASLADGFEDHDRDYFSF